MDDDRDELAKDIDAQANDYLNEGTKNDTYHNNKQLKRAAVEEMENQDEQGIPTDEAGHIKQKPRYTEESAQTGNIRNQAEVRQRTNENNTLEHVANQGPPPLSQLNQAQIQQLYNMYTFQWYRNQAQHTHQTSTNRLQLQPNYIQHTQDNAIEEDKTNESNNDVTTSSDVSSTSFYDFDNIELGQISMSKIQKILPNMSLRSQHALITGLGAIPKRINSTAIQDTEQRRNESTDNGNMNNSLAPVEPEQSKIQQYTSTSNKQTNNSHATSTNVINMPKTPYNEVIKTPMFNMPTTPSLNNNNGAIKTPVLNFANGALKTPTLNLNIGTQTKGVGANNLNKMITPPTTTTTTSNAKSNKGTPDENIRDKSYKTAITLTEAVADAYRYDKYSLAYELEKGFKQKCKPYKAHIKDNTIHYQCFDKIQHSQLPTILYECKAFNEGIEDIAEEKLDKEKDKGAQETIVYATITRNLNEPDFSYLKMRYQLLREDIKHVSQTTFTLNFRSKEIADQVIRTGSIQMGPELIYIRPAKEEMNNKVKVVQCFLCQAYGHFRSWCPTISANSPNGIPKCKFCSRKHETKDCPFSADARYYQCANCAPGTNKHASGTKDCPKFQEELKKAQMKLKPKADQPKSNRPTQQATADVIEVEEMDTVQTNPSNKPI